MKPCRIGDTVCRNTSIATTGHSGHDCRMARQFRLSDHSIIAFVAASDPDRARKFYVDTLGLALVSDDKPIALVFDADGTMLRVTIVQKGTPSSICRTRLDSAERRSRRRKPCRQ